MQIESILQDKEDELNIESLFLMRKDLIWLTKITSNLIKYLTTWTTSNFYLRKTPPQQPNNSNQLHKITISHPFVIKIKTTLHLIGLNTKFLKQTWALQIIEEKVQENRFLDWQELLKVWKDQNHRFRNQQLVYLLLHKEVYE